jgi:lipopolysaccharide transport system permease protein
MVMASHQKVFFPNYFLLIMPNPFYLFSDNRKVLYATTVQALRGRFVGNVLGATWLLLYPLLFLSMYSVVFIFILGVRVPGLGTPDYVVTIFCGLVPFLAFSEAFGVGTTSIVSNRGLLKNTLFPIELVVARDVIVGHATMALGMLLVWMAVVYQGHLYWVHMFVPIIYITQILMTLGLVWITSTLTVFFRDLQQATPILVLFMMLVSPIAYTSAMVPASMKPLLICNPLAWLMQLYRSCLLEGVLPIESCTIFLTFSILMFCIGYLFLSRLKPVFSDYV